MAASPPSKDTVYQVTDRHDYEHLFSALSFPAIGVISRLASLCGYPAMEDLTHVPDVPSVHITDHSVSPQRQCHRWTLGRLASKYKQIP